MPCETVTNINSYSKTLAKYSPVLMIPSRLFVDSLIQGKTFGIFIIWKWLFGLFSRFCPGEPVPAESKRRHIWQPCDPGVRHPVGPLWCGERLNTRRPDHVLHQVDYRPRRAVSVTLCMWPNLKWLICPSQIHAEWSVRGACQCGRCSHSWKPDMQGRVQSIPMQHLCKFAVNKTQTASFTS